MSEVTSPIVRHTHKHPTDNTAHPNSITYSADHGVINVTNNYYNRSSPPLVDVKNNVVGSNEGMIAHTDPRVGANRKEGAGEDTASIRPGKHMPGKEKPATLNLNAEGNREEGNKNTPCLTQPPKASLQQSAMAATNYLRKGGNAERNDGPDGPATSSQTGNTAAPAFLRWELDGEYEPKDLYSSKTAAMIEAHDGQNPALAIVLSCNLATHIENALWAGRKYQKIKQTAEAKIKELKAQQAKGATRELLSKNETMIRRLGDEVDEAAVEWGRRWRATDKLLDMVWVNAAILAPRDDDLDGDEIEEREHVKKGGYQRVGEDADPEDMIAHLDEVATQA
jgi:hypothetical protein